MTKKSKKIEIQDEEEIQVNSKGSSLAEFTKRPVPSEDELEKFEEKIESLEHENEDMEQDFDGEINGITDEEIEESLEEIYQGDDGKMVDVKSLTTTKRHGIIFAFFAFIFTIGTIGLIGFSFYKFFINTGTDATSIEFYVEAKSEVVAYEEFFYEIHYRNDSNVTILLPRIEAIYPENFVLLSTEPESKSNTKGVWDLPSLSPHTSEVVKIKGMMVGQDGETGVMFASMNYTPQNFSSEFKKSSSITTLINDIGIDVGFDFIATALVGEKNELLIDFNAKDNNFLNSFIVRIESPKNLEFRDIEKTEDENEAVYEKIKDGEWLISEVGSDEMVLPLSFVFTEKNNSQESIKIYFEKEVADGRVMYFFEKEIIFDVMKSDLNLALIVNGSREDQGVNFGDTLNYSLVFNNKGETVMKDVIIMAVFETEFLDWTTLNETSGAEEKGNTLTWTKNEIPELEEIGKHEEGVIDFSIDVIDIGQVKPGATYEVRSYAQFIIGRNDDDEELESVVSEDNRSNEILNLINSDLQLEEQVRYFDEDNITVGNGPLPLKVGEKTSFKVYWSITNNLHELTNVKVEVSLPEYMSWDEKNRTNVGQVDYDSENHRVIWSVGRLPLTVFRADAEFNVSVTPTVDDANKIMVLKPGTKVTATDAETENVIEKITDVKTSKLEDDDISQRTNDGVVRN